MIKGGTSATSYGSLLHHADDDENQLSESDEEEIIKDKDDVKFNETSNISSSSSKIDRSRSPPSTEISKKETASDHIASSVYKEREHQNLPNNTNNNFHHPHIEPIISDEYWCCWTFTIGMG